MMKKRRDAERVSRRNRGRVDVNEWSPSRLERVREKGGERNRRWRAKMTDEQREIMRAKDRAAKRRR